MRAPILFVVAVASVSGAFVVTACQDLNRPAYVPRSEPRKSCFSDVECPGSKCVKSSSDVQGTCAATDGDGGAAAGDGGAPTDREQVPPEARPQPGDIRL